MSSFVCSLIIFLYLLDNENTSRIVLASVGISTLIEGWKAKKVSKVPSSSSIRTPPFIAVQNTGGLLSPALGGGVKIAGGRGKTAGGCFELAESV